MLHIVGRTGWFEHLAAGSPPSIARPPAAHHSHSPLYFSFHCHNNVIEASFSRPVSHTKNILLRVTVKPEWDARSQGGSWAAQEFRCDEDESSWLPCLPLPVSL